MRKFSMVYYAYTLNIEWISSFSGIEVENFCYEQNKRIYIQVLKNQRNNNNG